jgi:Na+/proline symporter
VEIAIVWLLVFLAFYWAFCLYSGAGGALTGWRAGDYFIAGGGIAPGWFILTATAAAFSAWALVGHPGLGRAETASPAGQPFTAAVLAAIVLPFSGLLFFKRQWLLARRFGLVTPGAMLAAYFRSDGIRWLATLIAVLFAIAFIAATHWAAGQLLALLTDGWIGAGAGIWISGLAVLLYVAAGGLPAVARVGALQAGLLLLLVLGIAVVTLEALGGLDAIQQNLGALTPAGDDPLPGRAAESAAGGWAMALGAVFLLLGVQAAPAFSLLAIASRDTSPFLPQQVWASAFGVGLLLMLLAGIFGVGGHFLGADLAVARAEPTRLAHPTASRIQAGFFAAAHPDAIAALGLGRDRIERLTEAALAELERSGSVPTVAAMAEQGDPAAGRLFAHVARLGEVPALAPLAAQPSGRISLLAALIELAGDAAPWLIGLLALAAVAGLQIAGALFLAAAGTMLSLDLIMPRLERSTDDRRQMLAGRLAILALGGGALLLATTAATGLPLLTSLALALGLQLWPALLGACYWPILTRQGVLVGLITGITVTVLISPLGDTWFDLIALGDEIRIGLAAGIGLLCNLALAVSVSALGGDDLERRMQFHDALAQHVTLPERRRKLRPLAWILALAWLILALGPGARLAAWLIGPPGTALLGLPALWLGHLLIWLLGVLLLWFLAGVMQMSSRLETEVQPPTGPLAAELPFRI